jgi:long-chain fatty acid transport protein
MRHFQSFLWQSGHFSHDYEANAARSEEAALRQGESPAIINRIVVTITFHNTGRNFGMKSASPFAAAFSFAALLIAQDAQAQSFALRSQNAEGVGMAFAGAAAGSIGSGSMFFNPATMTMLPGRRSEWNFMYTRPDASYSLLSSSSPVQAGTGNIGLDGGLTTASYSSWQINDRLWLGIATGSPFGLRSKPENQNYSGQIYGRSSSAKSFNVTPSAAYKVNDWISIGAGLQVQYFQADLKQATGIGGIGSLASFAGSSLGPNAGTSSLRGDDIAFGFRTGVTITPMEGTTIGIGYRSMLHHDLKGRILTNTPNPAAPSVVIPITANLNLPEALNLGVSHQLNEQWQLHASFEWQNWSRFGRIPVVAESTNLLANAAAGRVIQSLNFLYEDSYHFAVGAEYQYNPNWTFRTGLGYDKSPVKDEFRGLRISDNDRIWTSIGASYKYSERLTFDIGYTHLFVKDAPVRIQPGHPDFNPALPITFIGEAKPSIDVVSFGLKYWWDAPSHVAMVEEKPRITK